MHPWKVQMTRIINKNWLQYLWASPKPFFLWAPSHSLTCWRGCQDWLKWTPIQTMVLASITGQPACQREHCGYIRLRGREVRRCAHHAKLATCRPQGGTSFRCLLENSVADSFSLTLPTNMQSVMEECIPLLLECSTHAQKLAAVYLLCDILRIHSTFLFMWNKLVSTNSRLWHVNLVLSHKNTHRLQTLLIG